MIKDLLAHKFTPGNPSYGLIFIEHRKSEFHSKVLKSLISRAGDLSKNNDKLKFALHSINFPESYNQDE